MPPPVRRTPPASIREAWTAAGIGRTALMTAGVAAASGAFLAFVGAFGLSAFPLGIRLAYLVPVAIVTGMIGLGGCLLATRLAPRSNRWFSGAAGGVLIFAPVGVIVWLTTGVLPGEVLRIEDLPGYVGTSFVVSLTMSLMAVAVVPLPGGGSSGEAAPAGPPSRFLERLPVRLRSAEIWAVEAEDHYLRVHTSAGQDLILLRMADAVAELEGQEGMQVHRSWWVARAGIADARRADGRATLTLKDGSEAPVSRTYAAELRRRGWA